MSIRLGIDTGGTYTDAVIHDDEQGVLASTKVLTRHHDLAGCVSEAIRAVLPAPRALDMVGVSTTLATNALVEKHGGDACLVVVGHGHEILSRANLGVSLGSNPVVFVAGGHRASGEEIETLDESAVLAAVEHYRDKVDAFAVAGLFAVRNPAHEQRVREIALQNANLPVTCAHELSAELDAPRRALTAFLNARLIPLIHELIEAVQQTLAECEVHAPVMVVKGDGSLVSAAMARERPVETILSGPAASTVGARHLTGSTDAVVVDIGGTTTDIGVLRGGWPALSEAGAHVAGLPTMVAAINAHTYGLGGDSEVHYDAAALRLGPRRAVPLSLLASEHPDVLTRLEAQSQRSYGHELDARFALRRRNTDKLASLTYSERELWHMLADGPVELEKLHERVASEQPLKRLRNRGLVAIACFTPSDAAHLLGMHDAWDRRAAELGAQLTARCWSMHGAASVDVEQLARGVRDALEQQSCTVIIDAVLREEHEQLAGAGPLLARALDQRRDSLLQVNLKLDATLVAIGASAGQYYPAIAKRLGAALATPTHLEVANAIGAAVSGILQRASALITLPKDDCYRVHAQSGTADFATLDAATVYAEQLVGDLASRAARLSGAGDLRLETQRTDRRVRGVDGHEVFLESRVTGIVHGDPVP